jgi:hypothetical protein
MEPNFNRKNVSSGSRTPSCNATKNQLEKYRVITKEIDSFNIS